MPETENLKEGKTYFSSWFQRFPFMVIGSIALGPTARQNIMVESKSGTKLLSSWQPENKGLGFNILFQGPPPVT
jgi:hypothetical protein